MERQVEVHVSPVVEVFHDLVVPPTPLLFRDPYPRAGRKTPTPDGGPDHGTPRHCNHTRSPKCYGPIRRGLLSTTYITQYN